MITRKIMPALFGVALLAAPVAATAAAVGTVTDNEKLRDHISPISSTAECTELQKQFDADVKMHPKAPKLNQAKMLRTEGQNLCASGQPVEGTVKLRQAIKDLGV